MTRGEVMMVAVLMLAVIATGVGVVYVKHQSRVLFVQLQQVRLDKDRVDMEWGRLQLELATSGALNHVMLVAGDRLKMHVPRAHQIVVVN